MSAGLHLEAFVVQGLPLIVEGDDLASMVSSRFELQDGDILCLASTIVSKAEGRMRSIDDFPPGPRALAISSGLQKDPRFVQAVLDESAEVLLEYPFLLVVTRFGHIGVNAGIDLSNAAEGKILLLPKNPTKSAEEIKRRLKKDCAVIITDTCGRPFRRGVTGVAIGVSGISAIRDWRGERDMRGRSLEITLESVADEIAGISNLMMGEACDATPAVVIRGLKLPRLGGSLFWSDREDVIRRIIRNGRASD